MVFNLSGCGQSPHCQSNDAQGVARALAPRKQFATMLTMAVRQTQTAGMVTARDTANAPSKIAVATDAAVARHEAEWEQNVIAAWQTLSPADLQEVCTALNNRDRRTFAKFADRVGTEVQNRNEPLLREAAAEVLEAIF